MRNSTKTKSFIKNEKKKETLLYRAQFQTERERERERKRENNDDDSVELSGRSWPCFLFRSKILY